MDTSKTVSILNDLIETGRDGQEGFRVAADGVQDPVLKGLFNDYAMQRAQFVGELQEQVRRLGGSPQQTGSVPGAMHRGWINIKAAVTNHDEAAVIAEAERGEDIAKRSYEKALEEKNLPSDLLTLIQRQYAEVKKAHDRVRDLEKASAHT